MSFEVSASAPHSITVTLRDNFDGTRYSRCITEEEAGEMAAQLLEAIVDSKRLTRLAKKPTLKVGDEVDYMYGPMPGEPGGDPAKPNGAYGAPCVILELITDEGEQALRDLGQSSGGSTVKAIVRFENDYDGDTVRDATPIDLELLELREPQP